MKVCLWFNDQAEEAARFYTSVLRDGRMLGDPVAYDEVSSGPSGKQAGSVMYVEFEVEGMQLQALNGGPIFTHSEAMSLVVERDTQEEIDEVWNALISDGGEESQCGWCKDRFGVSWQVVPTGLEQYLAGPDADGQRRAMETFFTMRKIDIDAVRRAYEGTPAPA